MWLLTSLTSITATISWNAEQKMMFAHYQTWIQVQLKGPYVKRHRSVLQYSFMTPKVIYINFISYTCHRSNIHKQLSSRNFRRCLMLSNLPSHIQSFCSTFFCSGMTQTVFPTESAVDSASVTCSWSAQPLKEKCRPHLGVLHTYNWPESHS